MNRFLPNADKHSRRAIPYAFELSVLLFLIGIVSAIGWFESQRVKTIWRYLVAPTLFVPVKQVYGDIMKIANADNGAVWVLTKYSVLHFSPTREPQRKTLLNGSLFQEYFDRPMNALSVLRLTGAKEAWAGSWYGELFHYEEGVWRQLSVRDDPIRGRILALAAAVDEIFVGGSFGLWRWSVTEETLASVSGAPLGEVTALEIDAGGNLLVAAGDTLWRRSGDGWRRFWSKSEVRKINVVRAYRQGEWILGTDNGVIILDSGGEELAHLASGYNVMAVIEHKGILWLATWGDGLLALADKGEPVRVNLSHTRSAKYLNDLTIDGRERLWLAIHGVGVSHAKLRKLEKLFAFPASH